MPTSLRVRTCITQLVYYVDKKGPFRHHIAPLFVSFLFCAFLFVCFFFCLFFFVCLFLFCLFCFVLFFISFGHIASVRDLGTAAEETLN